MPLIHLIDASPYIFRAYFSVPDSVTDTAGNPANAVHGFATFLVRYLEEEQPSHMAVAFDQSLTTSFRNEIYQEYKAQRALPPPELEAQQRDCMAMAEALGLAAFADERFEADDIIATIASRMRSGETRFVVVSPDKDLAQLVSADLTLFDFARGLRYGPAEVAAKFGVPPERIPDLLGLMGDAADNIPGVRGIGAKTAAALLSELGSLDALLDALDRVPSLPIRGAKTVGAKLAESREIARLSRQLATVSCDAPLEVTDHALAIRGPIAELFDPLFARLGFEGLRTRVQRVLGKSQ